MSVTFDFYKSPLGQKEGESEQYHARVLPRMTASFDDVSEYISESSTLTTGDVKAVIDALAKAMVKELKMGNRFHIEGIGYFQMTVDCPPTDNPGAARANAVRFKSVSFQPEITLKRKLRNTQFERAARKSHSQALPSGEMERRLRDYFSEHETMTRTQFQNLCGMTRSTAIRQIQALRQAGKLVNIAERRHPLYKPGENFPEQENPIPARP